MIALVDTAIYGSSYCTSQLTWMTSKHCAFLGTLNTFGTNISLFSMTYMSIHRVRGLTRAGVRASKGLKKIFVVGFMIVSASFLMAYLPLVDSFEDFFVNGQTYDPKIKIFLGEVSQ